jgi:acyl-CoA reductase-like NAD-dependent aldehyde dehydrogenase
MAQARLLIGGERVEGGAEPLEIENPALGEVFATVALPSDEQVDAAIASAREAARGWAATPALERGELLHEVATRIRAKTDELAETMSREGGKPRIENSDEVGWTAAAFDYYAEMGRNFAGRVIPPIESSQLALVVKEPMGVVACIVPWNYPLLLLAWKLAPALAAGNTTICKPSELTPLSTLALADCFDVLPPGVVNLVPGGGDVGARIVADPRVDCVAFTGSVETGQKIGHVCIDRVARINLELGGKDPFIVCSDVAAEIETAARGGAWAAYLNSGQVCTSAERFYVERPVYDDFLSAFVEHARSLRVGDPLDDSTDMGPMVSAAQRAKVERQLEAAVGDGAEIVFGGDHAGHSKGYFMAPTVVTGAAASTALLSEETFGPVAPIVPVRSLDEAIELANSTRFGLGANVYTRDLKTIFRCMRELKAGTVWINDPLTDNDAGPFGGFKQSGLGRELGQEGLEAFQETKHVHIESELAPKDWWYPYGGGGAPPHGG